MRADQAAGTEKSAVQVSMCAGTCRPQSLLSHASIIGHCRAPKTGGSVPGINLTDRLDNGYIINTSAYTGEIFFALGEIFFALGFKIFFPAFTDILFLRVEGTVYISRVMCKGVGHGFNIWGNN